MKLVELLSSLMPVAKTYYSWRKLSLVTPHGIDLNSLQVCATANRVHVS